MFALLRRRDFALVWTASLISATGDWVLFIGLPIYVYQLTGSTLATSAMFVAELVPQIALGSVAGVFVDRWDRKRTMVVAHLLLTVAVLPLAFVRSADLVWIAYVVAFTESLLARFLRPAEAAMLPRLVEPLELGWFMTAQAVGGLVGGLVIVRITRGMSPRQVLGVASVAFGLLDALLFVSPLIRPEIVVSLVVIGIVGIAGVAFMAGFNAILQTSVDDAYRGRVFGAIFATMAVLR